jgi:hypothetical protein
MTPRSVLDAGRKERQKWKIEMLVQPSYYALLQKGEPLYTLELVSRAECQEFIDDRVFRAMLRALADQLPPARSGHRGAIERYLRKMASDKNI